MTTTPTASPELPDLARLEALARAADQGEGQHIYTNPRDSDGWQANEAWHHAASPAAVLALIALARRAQPEGEAPQAEPVARVIAGEWGKKVAFLANGKDAPKVGTLLYTESGKETAQLSIGFANNDQGVHVSVMQRHPDDAITLLHQAKVPAGDSVAHFSIAVKQAAVPRTDLSKRIRAAATAEVTLAQAKLLIGAAEEIERAQQAAAPGALPERDPSKPAEQQGLFRKFDVRRTDGSDQPGGKHHGCRYYVLDLTHDQHAPAAMRAYAAACASTHPQLAADIVAEFGAHGTPEAPKKPAHGHRDDYYLLANGRRLGLESISRVRNMPNWVLAMELFATGSTSAHQICRDAGVDPDGTTAQRAAAPKGGT